MSQKNTGHPKPLVLRWVAWISTIMCGNRKLIQKLEWKRIENWNVHILVLTILFIAWCKIYCPLLPRSWKVLSNQSIRFKGQMRNNLLCQPSRPGPSLYSLSEFAYTLASYFSNLSLSSRILSTCSYVVQGRQILWIEDVWMKKQPIWPPNIIG